MSRKRIASYNDRLTAEAASANLREAGYANVLINEGIAGIVVTRIWHLYLEDAEILRDAEAAYEIAELIRPDPLSASDAEAIAQMPEIPSELDEPKPKGRIHLAMPIALLAILLFVALFEPARNWLVRVFTFY